MATTKLKCKVIKDPVFEVTLLVLWGGDFYKAKEYLLKKYGQEIEEQPGDSSCEGFVTDRLDDDINGWAFWIKYPKQHHDIVHEIPHLNHKIFNYKGIDINQDEVYAYYSAYWFKQICKLTH